MARVRFLRAIGPARGFTAGLVLALSVVPAAARAQSDNNYYGTPRSQPASQARTFTIEKWSGDGTTCRSETRDCRFTVRVLDARGNPVGGVKIVWRGNGGRGTRTTITDIWGFSSTTNIMSAGRFTDVNGTQTATIEGTSRTVSFRYSQRMNAANRSALNTPRVPAIPDPIMAPRATNEQPVDRSTPATAGASVCGGTDPRINARPECRNAGGAARPPAGNASSAGGGSGKAAEAGKVCSINHRLPAMKVGDRTGWFTPSFPGNLDFQVMLFNQGTKERPRYEYVVSRRNRNGMVIHFDFKFEVGGAGPTSTDRKQRLTPGESQGGPYHGRPANVGPVWLRIDNVRFGSITAQKFCR